MVSIGLLGQSVRQLTRARRMFLLYLTAPQQNIRSYGLVNNILRFGLMHLQQPL